VYASDSSNFILAILSTVWPSRIEGLYCVMNSLGENTFRRFVDALTFDASAMASPATSLSFQSAAAMVREPSSLWGSKAQSSAAVRFALCAHYPAKTNISLIVRFAIARLAT